MSHQKGTTTFLIALAFLLTQCDVSSSGGGFPDDDQGKDQETGTVTDIDGNEYKTIVIGEQEWMAENLRVTHFRDGTEIPSGLNHSEWKNTTEGAYAVYVHRKESHAKSQSSERYTTSSLTENDSATVVNKIDRTAGTGDVYGLLYNWYAIHDSPGLCPAGWRVATDEDFKALEKQWGMPDAEVNTSQWRGGDQNVGGKMKSTGTAYWSIPNVGATNESGFEGLPGGFRDHEGLFGKRGETGFWWTATEADRNLATERRLIFDDGSVYRGMSPKNNGFSVRCVRTGDGSHEDDKDDNDQNDDQDDEHEYGSVTDIDGNTYKTVVIGEQEWMAQNLRTTRYNNGNNLLTGFSNSEWETLMEGAYAIYDHQAENTAGINSPEEMAETYGLLYNRYAIEQNNLCPVNWEVPSRDDWQELVDHLINEYQYSNSRSDPESVGQALKIARQVQHPLGNSYATEEHPRWDFSSTFYGLDRFGFSALPAGMRSNTGNFISIGVYAHWWSATDEPLTPTSSPQTSLWYGHNYMVYGSVINDRSGLSVRCIRVDSQDEGDKADLPELQTAPVSDITSTSAISGGEVTHDGGAIVTDRGVVWSTSQNPTLQRNQGMTSDGSGTGHFTSTLKNLSPETRYYVRAYATNSEGTSYGNPVDFMSMKDDTDDEDNGSGDEHEYGSVTDIDGNLYKTIAIGEQVWMAENLRVTRYQDGSDIPTGLSDEEWDNTTNGAMAVYDHTHHLATHIRSEQEMEEAYGRLYNWYAVDNNPGLCPEGWSVPTDEEWAALVAYVESQGFPNNRLDPDGAGNALKSRRQIDSPLGEPWATDVHPRWRSDDRHHGKDTFGFSGLPGGFHSDALGLFGYWWTSSEFVEESAWFRRLGYSTGFLDRLQFRKQYGMSVRCIQN